jgi:myo-inositol 2-dehydrogenase/D-chiro-inositol 1-dehydrogenase
MSQQTTLGIGIVGCGRATESLHLPALNKMTVAPVTAVADLEASRLARVADKFNIRQRYLDYRELIADKSVKIVAVCVPAAYHEQVACAALEAGKHVYVEKPLALTEPAASHMVNSAVRAPTKSTVGFNLRSHRLVRQAKEIVSSGALGSIEMLRTSWTAGFHYAVEWPTWRQRRSNGGGVLFEMAVHHADLWRFLLDDEVEHVYAQTRSMPSTDDMSVSVTARMCKGSLVSAAYCQRTSDSHELEVYGQKGILRFSCYRADSLIMHPTADLGVGPRVRLKGLVKRFTIMPTTVAVGLKGGDYLQSYGLHWQSFLRSIHNDTPPLCTLEDGRQALRIVLAAVESAQQRQAVGVATLTFENGQNRAVHTSGL